MSVLNPDVKFDPDTIKLPVITASPTNGNASALGAYEADTAKLELNTVIELVCEANMYEEVAAVNVDILFSLLVIRVENEAESVANAPLISVAI